MNFFTEHLDEHNESYFEHMKIALLISAKMQIAAYVQLVHAIFPFIPAFLGGDVKSMKTFLSQVRSDKNEQ